MTAATRVRRGLRVLAPGLLVLGTTGVVGLLAYAGAGLAVPVVGLLVIGLVSRLANRYVLAATTAGLVVIGLVPVYAGRVLPGTHLGLTPAVAVTLVLALAALNHLPRLRLVPLDVAVAALCVLRVASYLFNFSGDIGAAIGVVLYVALPYAVFRLLSLREGFSRVAATAVVVIGAVVGGLAILEHGGTANPYFRLPSSGYEYADFAQEQLRFGQIRAEASFGHSIALGMFLALALVLAVALAVRTPEVWTRVAIGAGSALMLLGLVDTLSRGALLALGIGVALWVMLEVRRMRADHVIAAVGVGLVLLLATPLSGRVTDLVTSQDTNVSLSSEHRFAILDLVRDPEQFSLLGHKTASDSGVTTDVEERTGLNSFDNAYALVYVANGLLSALAFLTVGVLAFRVLVLPGVTPLERAWVAGLCAATINLFTVNLLTQYKDFYWLAVAVAASTWQRVGASDARKPARARSQV